LVRDFKNIPLFFKQSFFGGKAYYRPLVMVSFALDYRLFQLNPRGYYLTNLLLHISTSILVLYLMLFIGVERRAAVFTSLLFTVHPIHVEALSNIAGRSILLSAFFLVLSLVLYLIYRRHHQKRTVIFASLLCFIAALLSKESAVVLPGIILTLEILYAVKHHPQNVRAVIPLSAYFMLMGCYLALRQTLDITNIPRWASLTETFLGVMTFVKGGVIHCRLLVWPTDLYFDRTLPYFHQLNDPQLLALVIGASLVAVLMALIFRRLSAPTQFFILWIVWGYLPVSQFVPVRAFGRQAAAAEHFAYLPSIGMLLLIVQCLLHVYHKALRGKNLDPRLKNVLGAGLILLFMSFTINEHTRARHNLTMFQTSLTHNPHNTRVRISRALTLAKLGRFSEAEEDFRRVLSDEPANQTAQIGLGKSLCDQQKYLECLDVYTRAVSLGGPTRLLLDNLELTYQLIIKQYEQQQRRSPQNPDIPYSIGVMYARQGKPQEAVDYFQQALRLNPQHPEALFNLAGILDSRGESDGSRRRAMRYYEDYLRVSLADKNISITPPVETALKRVHEYYSLHGLEQMPEFLRRVYEQQLKINHR
ncbi:MAG: tetratricopeptide repeat protein, partial [Candidatus Omnitrophica bacterium]|nr:tetratricopeptide repeat protein [Candidatus Omnitrophota bacterium]